MVRKTARRRVACICVQGFCIKIMRLKTIWHSPAMVPEQDPVWRTCLVKQLILLPAGRAQRLPENLPDTGKRSLPILHFTLSYTKCSLPVGDIRCTLPLYTPVEKTRLFIFADPRRIILACCFVLIAEAAGCSKFLGVFRDIYVVFYSECGIIVADSYRLLDSGPLAALIGCITWGTL